MKAYQAVGWSLINCSAVTALTTTARITHGTRPASSAASALPAINFYELPGGRKNGIEAETFSISCRAITADTAMNLAKNVIDLFHGSSGTGVYGFAGTAGSPFEVTRASLRNHNGLIPEPGSGCFNVPVDILITYPVDAVS